MKLYFFFCYVKITKLINLNDYFTKIERTNKKSIEPQGCYINRRKEKNVILMLLFSLEE